MVESGGVVKCLQQHLLAGGGISLCAVAAGGRLGAV